MMVRRRSAARWSAVVLAALAVAACGDDGDEDAADDAVDEVEEIAEDAPDVPSSDVTVAVPDDACGLVSDATVEEIAGGPATPSSEESAFGDDFGPAVRCVWTNDDFLPPVEVSVTGDPELFEYARELVEGMGSIGTEEVSGVGDEAYTFDEGSGVLELVARDGDLVVQVRAATSNAAALIALANEVILNLS